MYLSVGWRQSMYKVFPDTLNRKKDGKKNLENLQFAMSNERLIHPRDAELLHNFSSMSFRVGNQKLHNSFLHLQPSLWPLQEVDSTYWSQHDYFIDIALLKDVCKCHPIFQLFLKDQKDAPCIVDRNLHWWVPIVLNTNAAHSVCPKLNVYDCNNWLQLDPESRLVLEIKICLCWRIAFAWTTLRLRSSGPPN